MKPHTVQRMIAGSRLRSEATGAFCLISILLLDACAGSQSALDPAGPQAGRISGIWWLMFWVCSAVFVIVMAFLLFAVFRPRPKVEVARDKTERNMTRVVAGSVAVTVVILF